MNNLKEFEVTELSNVVGGKPGVEATVKIEGVLDGIKNNTKITADIKVSLK